MITTNVHDPGFTRRPGLLYNQCKGYTTAIEFSTTDAIAKVGGGTEPARGTLGWQEFHKSGRIGDFPRANIETIA